MEGESNLKSWNRGNLIIAKRSHSAEFHAYLPFITSPNRPAECGPIARDKSVVIVDGSF